VVLRVVGDAEEEEEEEGEEDNGGILIGPSLETVGRYGTAICWGWGVGYPCCRGNP
jgi:hypothetical protein